MARSSFRGYSGSRRLTEAISFLQREFPGMVPTDIGYASIRGMDYAGRRRLRRFFATLQPVDRRGGR